MRHQREREESKDFRKTQTYKLIFLFNYCEKMNKNTIIEVEERAKIIDLEETRIQLSESF
jgi:hypothetical protein